MRKGFHRTLPITSPTPAVHLLTVHQLENSPSMKPFDSKRLVCIPYYVNLTFDSCNNHRTSLCTTTCSAQPSVLKRLILLCHLQPLVIRSWKLGSRQIISCSQMRSSNNCCLNFKNKDTLLLTTTVNYFYIQEEDLERRMREAIESQKPRLPSTTPKALQAGLVQSVGK